MVRGSYSPPQSRGRDRAPTRAPYEMEPAAAEESHSMISEATPVHGNRGEDRYYRDCLEKAAAAAAAEVAAAAAADEGDRNSSSGSGTNRHAGHQAVRP